jgi:hypothetical protein
MYIDHSDAEDFLNDISRASSNEDRPHIEVMSMSKCYELVIDIMCIQIMG